MTDADQLATAPPVDTVAVPRELPIDLLCAGSDGGNIGVERVARVWRAIVDAIEASR